MYVQGTLFHVSRRKFVLMMHNLHHQKRHQRALAHLELTATIICNFRSVGVENTTIHVDTRRRMREMLLKDWLLAATIKDVSITIVLKNYILPAKKPLRAS
jgi:hypothetical protein